MQTARSKSEQTQNEVIIYYERKQYDVLWNVWGLQGHNGQDHQSAKNNQSASNDLPQRIEQIIQRHQTIITQQSGQLESFEQNSIKAQAGIDTLQASVDAIEIPAELLSRIIRHRISLAIESQGVFWARKGMMSTIVLLCTMLYWTAKPNYDRIDNDLKYRYIKMKGEATPERIAELEENLRAESR